MGVAGRLWPSCQGPRAALPISAVGQNYEFVCLEASLGHLPTDARSGPLVWRREWHFFCDSAAGQSYVRALHTSGIAACGSARAVREGITFFLALGEPRRASVIVSTMPHTNA